MRYDVQEREKFYDGEHYVHPKEAYRKLQLAQNNNQTVYISGMTCYGKTSLALSVLKKRDIYCMAETLEPEDLEIPRQSGKTVTVVIDNLHYLPENTFYDECLKSIKALASRDDVWLILIGRSGLPTWLVPIHIQEIFLLIDENLLKINETEVKKCLAKWNLHVTDEECVRINEIAQHNPMALRIIAINMVNGRALDPISIMNLKNEMWEYVWDNVFDRWDPDILELVLRLSVVDRFSLEMAKYITGINNIALYIQKMKDLGNFLITCADNLDEDGGEVEYYIDANARAALIYNSSKILSNEEMNKAYYNAGLYYESNGDLTKALELYKKAEDFDQIASVLVKNSRQHPGSGYYMELKDYYLNLPESLIIDNPDLINAMCMLNSLLLNIEESERWYDELVRFIEVSRGSQAKRAKMLKVVLDMALPHRGVVNMVEMLKNAGMLVANRKLILPEFAVTSNLPSQMNGGKDFCEWSKKDKELAKSVGRWIQFTLGRNGKAVINLALAESYFEKAGDSFEISSLIAAGRIQAESVDSLEQIFVADGMLARLYLFENKIKLAIDVMENFRNMCIKQSKERMLVNAEAFLTRLRLYTSETSIVDEWMDGQTINDEIFICFDRYVYLTRVRVFIINGKYDEASILLKKLMYYSEVMHRTFVNIECKLLMAIVSIRSGRDDYDEWFKSALEIACEYNFVRIISREAGAVKKLVAETSWELDTPEKEKFYNAVKKEVDIMTKNYPSYMKEKSDVISLSENALAILKLQGEGCSIKEISELLSITPENVKYHSSQTYRKLGVNSKTGAVMEAKRRGLI